MPELAQAPTDITLDRVRQALEFAVKDIFATMFGVGVEIVPHEQITDSPRISSMIGFGGRTSGFVSLHFSFAMACKVTSGLLGMSVEEPDDTVRDTMAELVNMVAGGLRNQLSTEKEVFNLSLPSVVQGLEYSTRGPAGSIELMLGAVAEGYHFKMQLVMERKS